MAVKKTQQIFRSMKSVLSSVYGLEVGMDSGDSFPPPDVCNSWFPVLRRERSTASLP